jgi:hypothetical protein
MKKTPTITKGQHKKACAKRDECTNPNCPFQHPPSNLAVQRKKRLQRENAEKERTKAADEAVEKIATLLRSEQAMPVDRLAGFAPARQRDVIKGRTKGEDLVVACVQCHTAFLLTTTAQRFFLDNKLSLPKRCKECRAANKFVG